MWLHESDARLASRSTNLDSLLFARAAICSGRRYLLVAICLLLSLSRYLLVTICLSLSAYRYLLVTCVFICVPACLAVRMRVAIFMCDPAVSTICSVLVALVCV